VTKRGATGVEPVIICVYISGFFFKKEKFIFFFGVEFAGTNANPNDKSGSGSKSGRLYRSKASGSKSDSRKWDGNAIGYEYPALGHRVFPIG
jgi:hypothetical protein